jgi:hypothetical protein
MGRDSCCVRGGAEVGRGEVGGGPGSAIALCGQKTGSKGTHEIITAAVSVVLLAAASFGALLLDDRMPLRVRP